MTSIERGGVFRWVAKELASRPDMRLISHDDNFVLGEVPTSRGYSDMILQRFNDRGDASMHLQVAREPEGTPEQLVNYFNRTEELRSSLYGRRLDRIGDELWYGKDFTLTSDFARDRKIVGDSLWELSREVGTVRQHFLDITKGMRAKRYK